ncbi:MAG TPA: sulfite exporter TauE/SafE family protein [Anaerolineaceae bacterium]|nr:sulfite exporter TauE/SafE family protein [Anaerolineaceae bacterium]
MPAFVPDLVIGFAIGLSLGLLGGGGSILTVPALVYLVGQTPQAAVATSLAIVGANSAVGALFHQRSGVFNWKVAILFGGAGMAVAYLAVGLSKRLSPALLMVLFATLMLGIGALMLLQKHPKAPAGDQPTRTEKQTAWIALLAGAGTGFLTGILGVGGGFLIVPALVMLVGLPMYQAVGTSLAIIAANSLAGLLGHLDGPFDLGVTIFFVAAGILGTFAGSKLAHRLPAGRLRQLFAMFVILLAVFLMVDNVPKLIR